ncbi:MAG: PadR family transcriptional regulator [Thomasclavelia sp.]|jgi:PadR family transcriptional regulator PadR|nr:PadR family transcriptional regulator [Thomasclavelia sp.]
MIFNTGAALLDAIVLSVVAKEKDGTYGYKITHDIRKGLDVSESTLYPVLRRLQKDKCLETYDKQIDGRNRRYYRITNNGIVTLEMYRGEWDKYVSKINSLIEGGDE